MDTSMRWSPSLSAALSGGKACSIQDLSSRRSLSGERWGPSSRRLPSELSGGRGDPIRRSFRATRLLPQTALSGEPSFSWAHMVIAGHSVGGFVYRARNVGPVVWAEFDPSPREYS